MIIKRLIAGCAALTAMVLPTMASELTSLLKNNVGEGNSSAVLTLHWGDNVALDNLTQGVKFSDNATVKSIIGTALTADPRFYALANSDGEYLGYGFDTNGDNSAAFTVDGTKHGIATEGFYAVSDGADISTIEVASQYDHWKYNTAESYWKVFVNGTSADMDTAVKNGDEVALVYGSEDAAAPSTYFFLRPATEIGVWMQDEIVLNTENGKQVTLPMLATWPTDGSLNQYNPMGATFFADSDSEVESQSYSAFVQDSKNGALQCCITVKTPDEVIMRPYIYLKKDNKWTYVYGNDVKVSTIVAHPLTGISLEGIEDGATIELDNMGVKIITPVYEPADADFTGYKVSFGDESIVSIYSNVHSLVAHKAGTTTMTLSSSDGQVSKEYTISVKGPDATYRPDSFEEGMIWLNEEWFTHTSGSLNFIDPDGTIYYRAYGNQNDNMAFGATSQFATVYGGKLIVMSKQAWDGGDTREKSGGRVVVVDAKTMKWIGAIDNIGGDGRTVVGVNPSKAYLGTTAGIRVLNLDDITIADSDIEGSAPSRNGQIGDMVKAGKYVFATVVGSSVIVVDTESDKVVKTFTLSGVQGVVQSADGRVWMACANTLTPVDPATLESGTTYTIPGKSGGWSGGSSNITCSSGSWRHVNLMAPTQKNELIWGNGTFYRWDLDNVEDPSSLDPVFTYESKVDGVNYGGAYGAPGYDEATDTYMFASMPGYGTDALHNYYHFIDGSTGEIKKRVKLPEYWWFPAMPVNLDRYAPEFNLEDQTLTLNDEPLTFNVAQFVNDKDNNNYNINISLDSVPEGIDEDNAENTDAATVELNDGKLTITPLAAGVKNIILTAESNGRVTSKNLKITVNDPTGVTDIEDSSSAMYSIYTLSGVCVAKVETSAEYLKYISLAPGVYVARSHTGKVVKFQVK